MVSISNIQKELSQYRWLITLTLTFFVITIDQITKQIAINHLQKQPLQIIDSWLTFNLTYNDGAAFSINLGDKFPFFILGGIVIFFLGQWLSKQIENKFLYLKILSIALLWGGIIGNLIDRLRFGAVVDFISIHNFPIFNIADSCIVLGTILLVYVIILIEKSSLDT